MHPTSYLLPSTRLSRPEPKCLVSDRFVLPPACSIGLLLKLFWWPFICKYLNSHVEKAPCLPNWNREFITMTFFLWNKTWLMFSTYRLIPRKIVESVLWTFGSSSHQNLTLFVVLKASLDETLIQANIASELVFLWAGNCTRWLSEVHYNLNYSDSK